MYHSVSAAIKVDRFKINFKLKWSAIIVSIVNQLNGAPNENEKDKKSEKKATSDSVQQQHSM